MDPVSLFNPLVLDLSARLGRPLQQGTELVWQMLRDELELVLYLPCMPGARSARVELIEGGRAARQWYMPVHDPDTAAGILRRVDAAIYEVKQDRLHRSAAG